MDDRSNIKSRNGAQVAADEITFTLDLAGYFKCLNKEGQRLCGYSAEQVRRLHISQIISPELAYLVRQNFRRTIQRRIGVVYEIDILTKDRRRVVLETSVQLVMRNGQPIEIKGIAVPPPAL